MPHPSCLGPLQVPQNGGSVLRVGDQVCCGGNELADNSAAGAAESVAAAQRVLAAIPTEYDDDGPVPTLPKMLQAIAAAREVCAGLLPRR